MMAATRDAGRRKAWICLLRDSVRDFYFARFLQESPRVVGFFTGCTTARPGRSSEWAEPIQEGKGKWADLCQVGLGTAFWMTVSFFLAKKDDCHSKFL
jgi:hypothetical protein